MQLGSETEVQAKLRQMTSSCTSAQTGKECGGRPLDEQLNVPCLYVSLSHGHHTSPATMEMRL